MVSIYLDDSNRPRTTINDFEVHLCVFTPSFILKIVPVSGASTIACMQFTTPANLIGCTLGRSSLRLHEFRALTDHFSSRIDLQPVQDTRDVFINRFLSISEDFNRAVNSFRQRMEACLTNQLRRRRHARHTPRTSDTADQRKSRRQLPHQRGTHIAALEPAPQSRSQSVRFDRVPSPARGRPNPEQVSGSGDH